MLLLLALSCARPVELFPEAQAGCEESTEESLVPTPLMLPGRLCQACHVAGGQSRYAWTASGTVFGSPTAPCNPGGLAGVTVELIDENEQVLITLVTNRAGNFFTAEARDLSRFRARISRDGRVREMRTLQSTAACATCHVPGGPAPGRIFLD
jgi:hypothetical protein